MRAGILESSMRLMENKQTCNTYYFSLLVNELFDYEQFKLGTKVVLKQIPKLRSYYHKGKWRDYWANTDEKYDSFFSRQDVTVLGEYEALELEEIFLKSKNKKINWATDHPIRFTYFKGKQKGMLVIAIHHTLCDGQQSLKLISLIAQSYKATKDGKYITINTRKNNPVKEIAKAYGRKNLLKAFAYMKPADSMKDAKSILEHESDFDKEIDCDKIAVSTSIFYRSDLEKMKAEFPGQDVTLNDIFLCCGLKVIERFNRERNVNNRAIPLSFNVNLRRYLDNRSEKEIFLSNMFAPQSIIHDLERGSSYDSIMKTVQEVKRIPIGLPFYSMIHMMNCLPIIWVEKLVRGILKEVSNQVYQGFSITNAGKIESFFEGMNDAIDSVKFIPTGGKTGFPSISIQEYKGVFSITFMKYNDEEKLTELVQQYYEEELRKLMKGSITYED